MFWESIKSSIRINNNTYSGKNIQIINGKVIVDGQDVTPVEKEIYITVDGPVQNLKVDACSTITINGDVETVETGSGDVSCGNVKTDVTTGSGDVECKEIGGSVRTGSGNVKTELVGGDIKTGSGNVHYRGDKRREQL